MQGRRVPQFPGGRDSLSDGPSTPAASNNVASGAGGAAAGAPTHRATPGASSSCTSGDTAAAAAAVVARADFTAAPAAAGPNVGLGVRPESPPTLYVGNMHPYVDESVLYELLVAYGVTGVSEIKVRRDIVSLVTHHRDAALGCTWLSPQNEYQKPCPFIPFVAF